MTEDTKLDTVCFTGHRPEKLPDSPFIIKALKSMLYKDISDCADKGCRRFITGAARGVDLWAAEIIMEEKARGRDFELIAAIPYREHGSGFKGYDKWIFGNLMLKADSIVYVSEEYSRSCMKKRNEYMVEHSGNLIAVVSDFKSGTGQTIRLAQKAGLNIHIINAASIEKDISNLTDNPYELV